MEKIAIIVPTLNYCNYVRQTLESVAGAIDYLRREPDSRDVAAEVIVIDDGSTDGTRALLEELTRGNPSYQLILRDQPSSPSTVRNLGASISSGDPIFFLDGDDLFLENHLHECLRVFRAHPDTGFVKSHVSLSDPVHPEWINAHQQQPGEQPQRAPPMSRTTRWIPRLPPVPTHIRPLRP